MKRARLRTNPQNRDWQGDLAQTINKIAFALQKQGRLLDARARFGEEHAIYASLVRSDPTHTAWKSSFVASHTYLGSLLIDMGDLDAAAEHFADAQSSASELVSFDRQQVSWRRDLAAVLGNLAIVERMRGHSAASLKFGARAEALLSDALREAPQWTDWRRDHANTTLHYANALYASGDLSAAKRHAKSVLASVPHDRTAWRITIVDAEILLGRIAADQGHVATAHASWRQTADALRGVTIASGGPRLLDRRARALVLLGADDEARPILEELSRLQYANPDLMRLPRVAVNAKS